MSTSISLSASRGIRPSPFEPYRGNGDVEKAAVNLLSLPTLSAPRARLHRREAAPAVCSTSPDQVGGAYDIVESAPDVRDELREQHRVVLLDEYQDTSVHPDPVPRGTLPRHRGDGRRRPAPVDLRVAGSQRRQPLRLLRTFSRTGTAQTYSLMTSWRNDRGILGIANRVLEPLQRPGLDVPPLEPRPGAGEGTVTVEFPFTVDEEASVVAEWFAERRAAHEARNAGEATGR